MLDDDSEIAELRALIGLMREDAARRLILDLLMLVISKLPLEHRAAIVKAAWERAVDG